MPNKTLKSYFNGIYKPTEFDPSEQESQDLEEEDMSGKPRKPKLTAR